MANQLDTQITEEGPRNAVVKLTGVLDTSNIIETPAIELLDFHTNDERATLVGLRVDLLEYSIGQGLEVLLEWNSTNPKQIFPLAGRGRIAACNYGGFIPDMTLAGYDGSINLRTRNFTAGQASDGSALVQNFTVILELVKLYKA